MNRESNSITQTPPGAQRLLCAHAGCRHAVEITCATLLEYDGAVLRFCDEHCRSAFLSEHGEEQGVSLKRHLSDKALRSLFADAQTAPFMIVYRDGRCDRFGQGEPLFTLRLAWNDLTPLIDDDIQESFAEAYMDGEIQIDGDLADVLRFGVRCGLGDMRRNWKERLTGKTLKAIGRLRSVKKEKQNIAHHYDLGNDFFSLWLDPSLAYSCAYFQSEGDTLAQAQQQKFDHSLKKLRLQPGETLLDIGCGWGGLAIKAAEQYAVRSHGITLSEEQHLGAQQCIRQRGLQDQVQVELCDYEALAEAGRQFDKIVSIGMIEHVGKDNLARYVQAVKQMLKPGGLAMLHTITAVNEKPMNSWMERRIFPGTYLPTVPEFLGHCAAQGLRCWDVENLAPHYRRTLDCWSDNFEQAVDQIRTMYDERFVRLWRLYLRSCSVAFSEGLVEIHQMLVSNGEPRELPLTRCDLY